MTSSTRDAATTEAEVVDAARELLTANGLLPDVPDRLVGDGAPELLLASILATTPSTPHRAVSAGRRHRPRAASGSTGPSVRRPRRGASRRTALASVGALALVVALVASQSTQAQTATATTLPSLSYAFGDPTQTPPADLPDARGALLRLADAAGSTPTPPATGTVQHVVAQEWLSETITTASGSAGTTTAVYPTVTDRWVAADGSGQVDQRRSAAVLLDGSIDLSAGPSTGGFSSSDTFPVGTMDASAGTDLSHDPATLTDQVLGSSFPECSLDGWQAYCLADQVQHLFLTGVVSPDLSETLWQALAEQPDVGLLGATTDRVGRPGTAVAVSVPAIPGDTGDERAVLVIVVSEATGQMLSSEQVTVHSDLLGITEPRVVGFSAVTRSELTAKVGR